MKILMFLYFTTTSVLAADLCDLKNIKIYGEASSFEKINNKIEKVTEKYLIPPRLSEHLGTYENIVITSNQKLKSLIILGKEVPLKPGVGSYSTVGFNLSKALNLKNIEGDFKIEVIGMEQFKCSQSYKVIVSE
jgi:hypothetical protein